MCCLVANDCGLVWSCCVWTPVVIKQADVAASKSADEEGKWPLPGVHPVPAQSCQVAWTTVMPWDGLVCSWVGRMAGWRMRVCFCGPCVGCVRSRGGLEEDDDGGGGARGYFPDLRPISCSGGSPPWRQVPAWCWWYVMKCERVRTRCAVQFYTATCVCVGCLLSQTMQPK